MDLQGALIVGGVTVAVCAVLILVSLFKTSGTSYEEAVAEQRRATSELLALAGSGNKQALKKNKKAGKKAKEKKQKEAATGSERDSDVPVDSGLEEEAAAPSPSPAPAATSPPAPAARPHVEFGESTVLDEPITKPAKNVKKEDIVEKKDVKEVKSSKAKGKQSKAAPAPAPVPAPASAPVTPPAPVTTPAAESVDEAPPKDNLNSGDFVKEQRKTKKNEKRQVVDDSGDKVVREETVAPLNPVVPSELTTDKLLRQPPPAAPAKQKKKKAEQNMLSLVGSDVGALNVPELVRLVSEAALSRNEIQILTDALLNKQHGVLPQHSDWTEGPNDPVQKLKKQLSEKEKALADEQEAAQAIRSKLKELRTLLDSERARANAASRALEEAATAHKVEAHTLSTRLQRLLDENQTLAQDKHHLQSKLQSENEAAAQRVQLEMHIQRQNETEAALMSQVHAMQSELQARVIEVTQVRCELGVARDAGLQATQHAAELAQQLQESNRVYREMEAALAHSKAAAAEARAGSERAAEAQARLERARDESDRANRQLNADIASLREQLAARDAELKESRNHTHNGLPPQDDSQKKLELKKLEAVVEKLQGELAAALTSQAEEQKQLATLQQELQQYKDKNNELRTKNWKVMEALQAAEKAIQSKAPLNNTHEAVAKALEAQSAETAEVLRAACPAAAPAGAPGPAWLRAFADQLATVLRAATTDHRVPELQAQNAQLQELVEKYKNIINDTEGVLSELQHNVTAEEERWARQLRDKQRELDHLQQHTITQMQSKIDALQGELERSRAPHSLADVERGLEETNRLLSISGKHQTESLNGPSQVGLEEK